MKIGEQLRQLREERGLTQAQLAEGHTTPSYISYIERTNSLPSRKILRVLAERLSVPLGYFEVAQEKDRHPTLMVDLERMRAYLELGELETAEKLSEEIRRSGIDEKDASLRGRFALSLGLLYHHMGRSDDALRELRNALDLTRAASDWVGQTETALWLSTIHRRRGELELALRHGSTAVGLVAEYEGIDPGLAHRARLELALTLHRMGDYEAVREVYESLKAYEADMSPEARARLYLGLSQTNLDYDNVTQALAYANQARQLTLKENELNLTAEAECRLAAALIKQHKYTDALPSLQRSLSRWEGLPGYEAETARLLLMRARVEAALLRFKDAEEYVQRALKLDYRTAGAESSPAKAEAYSVRAQIQREERYLSEARGSFENASRIYQQSEMYALAAENLKQAADIMIRLDDPIRAYNTLNQALELTKKRQTLVRE
ncbi:MAG TPA: tetratricopeptide repeat protein [Bacillota bacterium]|nr:tetratricopeptide repeat protein [Bacillota bacterium]